MFKNSAAKIELVEKWIFYFLCGFSFFLPLSKAAGNTFLALILLAFVVRLFFKRDDAIKNLAAYKDVLSVIGILFLVVFLSALTSGHVLQGLKSFLEKYILHAAVIFPVLCMNYERKKIISLAKFLFVGMLLSNFSVIVQAIPHLSEGHWRFGGITSGMIQGSLLSMSLPVYVLMFMHLQDYRQKIFAFIAVIIGIIAILLTGTRGAWLAVVILIPLVVLIHSKRKLKSLAMIFLSLSLIAGITIITPTLSQRVETITDLKMQSNSERLLMWESAWQMFKDYPILGVGYGQYKIAYQTKYISPLAKERTLEHAHNNFMQMLGECGILGFSAFVFMWIYLSRLTLRGWFKEKNIAYLLFFCVMWGMMLHGFTEFNFETSMTSKIFWYSLALFLLFTNPIKSWQGLGRKNF